MQQSLISQAASRLGSIPESSDVGSRRNSINGTSVTSSAQDRILKGSQPKPPPALKKSGASGRPTVFEDRSKPGNKGKRTSYMSHASSHKADKDCAGMSSCADSSAPRSARKMVCDPCETFQVGEGSRKPRNMRNSTAGAPGQCLDGHYRGKELAPRESTPFVESNMYDKAPVSERRSCKKLAPVEFTPYVESDMYDAPTAQFERMRGGGKALTGQGPAIDEDMAGQTTSRRSELRSTFKPHARIKPDPKELAGAAGNSVEFQKSKNKSSKKALAIQEDTAEAVFGGEKERPDPPFADYQDKSLGTKFVGRKSPVKPTKEIKEVSRYKEEQFLSGPMPAGVEPKARNHWLHDECKREPPKKAKGAQKSDLSIAHSNDIAGTELNLTRRRRVEPNFVEGNHVAGVASSRTLSDRPGYCSLNHHLHRCDRSDAGYSAASAPNSAASAGPRYGQASQISLG